jgi:hypothetical protein
MLVSMEQTMTVQGFAVDACVIVVDADSQQLRLLCFLAACTAQLCADSSSCPGAASENGFLVLGGLLSCAGQMNRRMRSDYRSFNAAALTMVEVCCNSPSVEPQREIFHRQAMVSVSFGSC